MADVAELDENMQTLTHKLENARRDFVRARVRPAVRRRDVTPCAVETPRPSQDYEKAQRVLDKINAYNHDQEQAVMKN
jgi:hypothetical protein